MSTVVILEENGQGVENWPKSFHRGFRDGM